MAVGHGQHEIPGRLHRGDDEGIRGTRDGRHDVSRTTIWRSGATRDALGMPPLSIASQLYQPARPAPICAIHGQTCSGGASIVIACVEAKIGSGIIASTGNG